MSINSVSTLYFNNTSRADLSRLQSELVDLQRQVGSQHIADDLQGYGASSAQILSARGLIAQTDANTQTAKELDARFTATDTALAQAHDASESLRLAILTAIGQDNGTFVSNTLQSSFDSARTALNQSYNGEALFGGERADATPVNVSTLTQLGASASVGAIFDEAARQKTVDLGDGAFAVGDKVSSVGTDLFDAMRSLKQLVDAAGGALPQPLTAAQKTALQAIATQLSTASSTITNAQGVNGQLQNTVAATATRLTARSDMLNKTVSDVADANLADVATRISAVQVQYQAVAQTYSKLSHLSLLDFLPVA
jgi:flagellar hook-associated protein 3 FlgL